jgi:hypothetical protein
VVVSIEKLFSWISDIGVSAHESDDQIFPAYAQGVRDIIESGVDVNCRYEERNLTPLMKAAQRGLPVIVATLLELGADISLENADGQSALTYAVAKIHKPKLAGQVVNELIARRASVEPVDKNGQSPLYYAVLFLQVGIAQQLLTADPNGAIDIGQAAKALVQLLVTGRYQRNYLDGEREIPIQGLTNMLRLLIDTVGMDIDILMSYGGGEDMSIRALLEADSRYAVVLRQLGKNQFKLFKYDGVSVDANGDSLDTPGSATPGSDMDWLGSREPR